MCECMLRKGKKDKFNKLIKKKKKRRLIVFDPLDNDQNVYDSSSISILFNYVPVL